MSAATDEKHADGFKAWLPRDFELQFAVKREGDQWFALLIEFDITGCGATEGDAVNDAVELLVAYLEDYFEEGASFADALRPIPSQLRVRIRIESAIGAVLRTFMIRLPLSDEATYELPPGLLPSFAH